MCVFVCFGVLSLKLLTGRKHNSNINTEKVFEHNMKTWDERFCKLVNRETTLIDNDTGLIPHGNRNFFAVIINDIKHDASAFGSGSVWLRTSKVSRVKFRIKSKVVVIDCMLH